MIDFVEVRAGIEPAYADLQSDLSNRSHSVFNKLTAT